MRKNSKILKVASSPTTCPERLRELANDKKTDGSILRVITSNPNTPKDVLLYLGEFFPKEFMNNPVLELLLLENPNLIKEMPRSMVINLLELDPMLKFWTIETVIKHFDYTKIFEKIKLPNQLLKTFAQHPDNKVRSIVARNPSTTADILILLAKDTDSCVRKLVASNPKIPQYIMDILSKDDECVREGLAVNKNVPLQLLKNYSKSNDNFRALIASNPNTPLYILETLSQDTIFDVRASVAGNKNVLASILTVLFQNCEDIFKCFLSENNHLLLVDKLQQLNFQSLSTQSRQDLWNKYFDFRLKIASHPNTPEHILKIMINCESYSYFDAVKICSTVAKNKSAGADILKTLSQHTSSFVRSDVACNRNTPVDILEVLSHDDMTSVRIDVALNPNTPRYILEILSQDERISIFVPKSRLCVK